MPGVDASFPKTRRVLLGRDFERVMRNGRKIHTRNLIVFAARGPTDHARLGLAVGRKVGKAACRNRWKRLIREAFRLTLQHRLLAVDLVVAVKAAPALPPQTGTAAPGGKKPHGRNRRDAPGLAGMEGELLDAVRRLGAVG